MAATGRAQHPAKRLGRNRREHSQKRSGQKQAALFPALFAKPDIRTGEYHANRNPLAFLQSGTRPGTGHMVLAIWLCHRRQNRMERHTAIYGRTQSHEVLPARSENRTRKAARPSSPRMARQRRMGQVHREQPRETRTPNLSQTRQ